MKFAVNHPWKFDKFYVAYMCGWLQACNVVIVELVNFIALLTQGSILDVIMNFLALVVIAEFDEYFYSAVKNDDLCKVVRGEDEFEEFIMIQMTTS